VASAVLLSGRTAADGRNPQNAGGGEAAGNEKRRQAERRTVVVYSRTAERQKIKRQQAERTRTVQAGRQVSRKSRQPGRNP